MLTPLLQEYLLFYEDIFYVTLEEGDVFDNPKADTIETENGLEIVKSFKFSKPVKFRNGINTPKHDAAIQLTQDGKKLYIFREGDIWVTQKNDTGWTDPVRIEDNTKYFEPSTTSFTTIDVGNVTNNVIPPTCKATLNIRFNDLHSSKTLTTWLDEHIKRINKLYQSKITMEVKVSGESFINPNTNFTKMIVDQVYDQLKVKPVLSTSGGTSDARFIKDFSEVLELGLVGRTMHQVNEMVDLNDVVKLKELYHSIIKKYFSDKL